MSRFRYGSRLAVALAGMALLVSACGGGDVTTESASAPALADQNVTGGEAGSYAAGAAQPQRSQASAGQVGQVKVVPQDRAIIYVAETTVRVKDVTAAADRARQIVTTAGGYLASEKSEDYSDVEGSAQLVFKVPPGRYPDVLNRLGKELGTRQSLQQNTEDVTEQIADVESRLKSAKSSLDSLRTLLKRADTIGQVLNVEREISSREADLESLQARQKTLASQTSLATLTLNLVGPAVVITEPEDGPSGFLGGLRSGWKGFVTAVKVGLTVLGVLLPWLIVIVPLWLVVLWVRRTRKGAPRTAPAPLTADSGEDGSGEDEPAPSERS
ncbi:DUF4349 domain-containing protein [Streptosporangium sp. NPDC087985]|uniref:DUF4349 domain-containing protein n=1 Tax=Streptosporangium sp. NPDC087985 TaxID=3366196 RepID=UPI0038048BF6